MAVSKTRVARKSLALAAAASTLAACIYCDQMIVSCNNDMTAVESTLRTSKIKIETLIRNEPTEITNLVRTQAAISAMSPAQKYENLAAFATRRAERINRLSIRAKDENAKLHKLAVRGILDIASWASTLYLGSALTLSIWPRRKEAEKLIISR